MIEYTVGTNLPHLVCLGI